MVANSVFLGDFPARVHASMSILRKTLLAASFLALAGAGLAATPSRHEVLAAISVLERSVTGQDAMAAAKTIVVYAQDSDDVVVDIGPGQLPWVSEEWGLDKERELECQSMLLAAFVAGNIKSQIRSSRAGDDTYSGWVFAIDAYNRLREKKPFRSPSMEELSRMQANGTLLRHARQVQSQEDQAQPQEPEHTPLA